MPFWGQFRYWENGPTLESAHTATGVSLTENIDDATRRTPSQVGRWSLALAVGSPALGLLVSWPSGNFLFAVVVTLLGGAFAAMLGQFAISDARQRGEKPPRSGRCGRCLGWFEVAVPLVLAVLFYIALGQAPFV